MIIYVVPSILVTGGDLEQGSHSCVLLSSEEMPSTACCLPTPLARAYLLAATDLTGG